MSSLNNFPSPTCYRGIEVYNIGKKRPLFAHTTLRAIIPRKLDVREKLFCFRNCLIKDVMHTRHLILRRTVMKTHVTEFLNRVHVFVLIVFQGPWLPDPRITLNVWRAG